MRRFLRILLNAATVLSLLLCVATVGLWVRSYTASESLCWFRSSALSLSASRGRMSLYWGELSYDEGSNYRAGLFHFSARPPEEFYLYDRSGDEKDWRLFDHGGFSLVGGQWNDLKHCALVLPCWSLTA